MAKKPEAPKKLKWKGKTEEDRQDSMFLYTTLNNIQARFGQQMTPIENNVIELVKRERIALEGEEEEEEEPAEQ